MVNITRSDPSYDHFLATYCMLENLSVTNFCIFKDIDLKLRPNIVHSMLDFGLCLTTFVIYENF
jgi:hypothetical protein